MAQTLTQPDLQNEHNDKSQKYWLTYEMSKDVFGPEFNPYTAITPFDGLLMAIDLSENDKASIVNKLIDCYQKLESEGNDSFGKQELYSSLFYVVADVLTSVASLKTILTRFKLQFGSSLYSRVYNELPHDLGKYVLLMHKDHSAIGDNDDFTIDVVEYLDWPLLTNRSIQPSLDEIIIEHICYLVEQSDLESIEMSYSRLLRDSISMATKFVTEVNKKESSVPGFIAYHSASIQSILIDPSKPSASVNKELLGVVNQLQFPVKVTAERYYHPVIRALNTIIEMPDLESLCYANNLLLTYKIEEVLDLVYTKEQLNTALIFYDHAPLSLISGTCNGQIRGWLLEIAAEI